MSTHNQRLAKLAKKESQTPFVHGPREEFTEGHKHLRVTISQGRDRITIRCKTQAQAYRLKSRLIGAIKSASDIDSGCDTVGSG